MVKARSRVLEFDVAVDRDRMARSGLGGSEISADDAWSAEHLVLAALRRCTLTSLDYYLRRAGLAAAGSGQAHGIVTKRETDGLFAFVDIEARCDVEVMDPPDHTALRKLLESAERGCFGGDSLTARPRYHRTVNGEDVT